MEVILPHVRGHRSPWDTNICFCEGWDMMSIGTPATIMLSDGEVYRGCDLGHPDFIPWSVANRNSIHIPLAGIGAFDEVISGAYGLKSEEPSETDWSRENRNIRWILKSPYIRTDNCDNQMQEAWSHFNITRSDFCAPLFRTIRLGFVVRGFRPNDLVRLPGEWHCCDQRFEHTNPAGLSSSQSTRPS